MKAADKAAFRRAAFLAALPSTTTIAVRTSAQSPEDRCALAVDMAARIAAASVATIEALERTDRGDVGDVAVPADNIARTYNLMRDPSWAPCPEPVPRELAARVRGAMRRLPAAQWPSVLERAKRSDYLCGRGSRAPAHPVNIAWLLQPDTIAKLSAGHFDDSSAGIPRVNAAAKNAAAAAQVLEQRSTQ